MESSDGRSYVFIDQKLSDAGYHEKPGICCFSSLFVEKKAGGKAILCQGGFDHRVRLFSTKTLKMLANLKFHGGIVNNVAIELLPPTEYRQQIHVYSVSEDCQLACWTLDI